VRVPAPGDRHDGPTADGALTAAVPALDSSSWDEAHALAGLGRCALADGDAALAETLLRQALEIFRRTGAADAPALLAELESLGG
jgi:hypothetical protein